MYAQSYYNTLQQGCNLVLKIGRLARWGRVEALHPVRPTHVVCANKTVFMSSRVACSFLLITLFTMGAAGGGGKRALAPPPGI